MVDYQQSVETIRQQLLQLRELLDMDHVPADVRSRGSELTHTAIALADDVLATTPAAALGSRGGSKTAERGPEYFAKIASMRKTKAGGRPRKETNC
ncbi:MAG: hypothetical protein SGI92_33280 [Bryobacteraceae bacterium]|nr:hypothetical protein [Bryobacteraceae bacterium]